MPKIIKPRPGGRPSKAEAEKIVAQIIVIARDLFFAHGYGGTSIEMIARAARISKPTFYNRFADKPAIFRAVANSLIEKLVPPGFDQLFEGQSCEEILLKLAAAIVQASLSPQALAIHRLITAEALRFPELPLILNEQGTRRAALERLAGVFERETKAGRLEVKNPTLTAEAYLHMVIGLPQRRALGHGKKMSATDLQAWSRYSVELFLHGCGPKSRSRKKT